MTKSRDPEALLAAYFREGMEVLPDRVVDAVLDEVHRTRQRAVRPWRTQPMFKFGLAAAAVVAVVIGGGAMLGAFRAPPGPGTPSPTPGATPAPTPAPTPSPSPTPELPAFPGVGPRVNLVNGTTYRATLFSQPMTLTMPDVTAELGPDAVANGVTYAGGGHAMQITYPPIEPTVEELGIAMTIHDDLRIDTDFCRPDGRVQEVPATPEAVGEWLHDLAPGRDVVGGAAPNVVTDQPDMTVDGRVAKVYDLRLGSDCDSTGYLGDFSMGSNEFHRIYAIPTGTDTILVINWNLPRVVPQKSVNAISDRLVASFQFD
jgi:hypothetical protein